MTHQVQGKEPHDTQGNHNDFSQATMEAGGQ